MTSQMRIEALEAPRAVERLLADGLEVVQAYAEAFQRVGAHGLLTIARGSSDNAADYFGYLAMGRMGCITTSLPMSLFTLQQSPLRAQGYGVVAFSQSGESPDLVHAVQVLRARGALSAAIVNRPVSTLGAAAQWVMPLQAGVESSVAATKSFIAQMAAAARLVAWLADDAPLKAALPSLVPVLRRAVAVDATAALAPLVHADRALVVGRGLGLSVAREVALKLKEVCGIQAEAFSSAEVQHGPMALIEQGYPLLVLAPRGPEQQDLLAVAVKLRGMGATVVVAAPEDTGVADIPLVPAQDAALDPISAVATLYPLIEGLARARGLDPDAPRHLRKVTRTQ